MKFAEPMATVYITFVGVNGESFPGPRRDVVNPYPALDDVVKAAMISSGGTDVTVTRRTTTQTNVGVITEPPLSGVAPSGELTVLSFTYDSKLSFIVPGVGVDVGSLNRMFPSYRWAADGGGAAIVVSRAYRPLANWFVRAESGATHQPASIDRSNRVQVAPSARAPAVEHRVGRVPGVFTVQGVRMTRSVAEANGVRVRPFDTILDGDGVRWYVGPDGLLRDAVIRRLNSSDVRVSDGVTVTPRDPKTRAPDDFEPGQKTVLVIRWPSGDSEHVHARAFGRSANGWGWTATRTSATVDHVASMCMKKHGVASPHTNPVQCLEDGGTWDRPCETDTECPFYDARRGRGGCQAGFCEMPMSVDRKSFRAPVTQSPPLRRGCAPGTPGYPWCPEQPESNARFESRIENPSILSSK